MSKGPETGRSLTDHARENIRDIHGLSFEYNGSGKDHSEALLDLAKKHIREIEELYENGDSHFTVEVGDLIILCMEMIIEQGRDPDDILDLCYGRYKGKLNSLIAERGKGASTVRMEGHDG